MTALQRFLTDAGGAVTVEAFMRWALYDPKHGYYSRRIADVGRSGDFATSATLSPALAQAVAAWAKTHRAEVTSHGRWHLIEVGPGNGRLAAEILRALGQWSRAHVTYHLVETSIPLAERQRANLSEWSHGTFAPTLRWHGEIETALGEAGGAAHIVTNELVDSFPCAVITRSSEEAEWQEVGLRWDDANHRAVEVLNEPSAARVGEVKESADFLPATALRVEIHFAYRDWLRRWRRAWQLGRMLTIDYGGPIEALYHRRPRGTLRGYFRQQRVEGAEIFERVGHQDLTADVNFTDLIRWGEALGLEPSPVVTQRDFVLQWNPQAARADIATTQLLDAAGAGEAFKVLEQKVSKR